MKLYPILLLMLLAACTKTVDNSPPKIDDSFFDMTDSEKKMAAKLPGTWIVDSVYIIYAGEGTLFSNSNDVGTIYTFTADAVSIDGWSDLEGKYVVHQGAADTLKFSYGGLLLIDSIGEERLNLLTLGSSMNYELFCAKQ